MPLCRWQAAGEWLAFQKALPKGVAQVHPLPEAGLAYLDLFMATRHVVEILWAVDMAHANPTLRAGLDAWVEWAGGHVRRFLEGGSAPPSRSAAVSPPTGVNPKVPPCP